MFENKKKKDLYDEMREKATEGRLKRIQHDSPPKMDLWSRSFV
jgi:hypothetical protein